MLYMLRCIGARSGYIINLVSLCTVHTISDRFCLYFTFMSDLPSLDTGLLILTPSFIQRLLWRGEERIGSADKGRGWIVPEVWVISSSSHCFHTQIQIYKTDTNIQTQWQIQIQIQKQDKVGWFTMSSLINSSSSDVIGKQSVGDTNKVFS